MKPTKTALRQKLRQLRDNNSEVTGNDFKFVLAILTHHPNLASWYPVTDVVRINTEQEPKEVAKNTWIMTTGFMLHYVNGERWAFSWEKCLRNMTNDDVRGFASFTSAARVTYMMTNEQFKIKEELRQYCYGLNPKWGVLETKPEIAKKFAYMLGDLSQRKDLEVWLEESKVIMAELLQSY